MENFDAFVIPGGFGAAKNLSDYAVKGDACAVDSQVDAPIKSAHRAKKPICAICIAPVLIAKSLGAEHKPVLTIGCDEGTAAHIEKMGGGVGIASAFQNPASFPPPRNPRQAQNTTPPIPPKSAQNRARKTNRSTSVATPNRQRPQQPAAPTEAREPPIPAPTA